jgi:hypothetical protein
LAGFGSLYRGHTRNFFPEDESETIHSATLIQECGSLKGIPVCCHSLGKASASRSLPIISSMVIFILGILFASLLEISRIKRMVQCKLLSNAELEVYQIEET